MEMTDSLRSRREAFLGDPELLASIRGVLRGRGVGDHEVDDQCRQVVAEAWAAKNFPDHTREEARKYLNGIARRVAIDHAHEGARLPTDPLPSEEGRAVAACDPPLYEARDAASRLFAKGAELFPRTFPWFVRSAVLSEEASVIARGEGVSPGYVRHEVSEIRRALRVVAAGLGVVAVVILAFFGVRSLGHRRYFEVATPDTPPKVAPSVREAAALRREAARFCEDQAYPACAVDLEKARDLDPAGETPDVKALREKAEEYQMNPPHQPPLLRYERKP